MQIYTHWDIGRWLNTPIFTKKNVSDWVGEEVTIRARTKNHPWRTIRVARFPYSDGTQAGPYACAPTREGFEVLFTRWEFDKPDLDLHTNPTT